MEIYKGRETRHRAKNLAHATDYEFRLKVRLCSLPCTHLTCV